MKILKVIKKAKPIDPAMRPLTLRDQKVVSLVAKGGKSKAEILRQAGFSPKTARTPEKVFNKPQIKAAIDPVIEKMQQIRENALAALARKNMDKEGTYNLTVVSNIMTKDVELLSGRPTSREEYVLDPEEADKLDELLELNGNDKTS